MVPGIHRRECNDAGAVGVFARERIAKNGEPLKHHGVVHAIWQSIIARMASERPVYLQPYERAAHEHGAGFGSLLWASPATQAARFDAIAQMVDLNGRSVLDVGCGRADLLDYLMGRKIRVSSYIGIEGVEALAEAAREKRQARAQILHADFVAEPRRMFVGAEVVVISGSLNTMDAVQFYATLGRAFEAAGEMLVFNFLCSSQLAGANYLSWHRTDEVMGFVRGLSERVRKLEDYMAGDCTVAVGKTTACV